MARISYTREETIRKLEAINKVEEIYSSDIINYKGNTKDTNEKYTEVIAEEIFNNPDKYNFENIKQINRDRTYNVGHDGVYDESSIRKEEIIAMKMYKNDYPAIGKMIDYQVPLKDVKDTKAGKVDLISYKEDENTVYLIELKNDESIETLLRCVLEITTYTKQITAEKLKSDFEIPQDAMIKPAVLVFEDTRPYDDLNDKYVNKLIEKFGIDVFTAKESYAIEKN